MLRYWITLPHAATLVAHAALLAAEGEVVATAADPVQLSVGELGERIWAQAGPPGRPQVDLLGIRRGETLTEVLVGEGEQLGPERRHGIAAITGDGSTAGAAWVRERLPERASREAARAVWLEAMRRPGLVAAPPSGSQP
jgi:FlaA1/EpsC-like NDP-sugar epimerase